MFIAIMILLGVVALEMKACVNEIQITAVARISSSCSHIWFHQHNGPNAFSTATNFCTCTLRFFPPHYLIFRISHDYYQPWRSALTFVPSKICKPNGVKLREAALGLIGCQINSLDQEENVWVDEWRENSTFPLYP